MTHKQVNKQPYPLIRLKNMPDKVFELIKADWTNLGNEGLNAVVQSIEYGICSEHTDNIEFLSTKEATKWRNTFEQQINNIYTVLVNLGGALESERPDFVYHHTKNSTSEWRFQAKFGFGGKYRIDRNAIDFYKEDETPELLELQKTINVELLKIFK